LRAALTGTMSAIAACVVVVAAPGVAAQTTQPLALRPFRFGAFERALTGLSLPMSAAIAADGTIYIADAGAHEIAVFARDGQRLRSFGSLGDGEGQLRAPASLAMGDDGLVYVADTGNSRVQVFDATGAFVRGWGERGREANQLCSPRGIAIAGDRVCVADTGNQHVKVFAREANLLLDLGSSGEVALFRQPVDVAMDSAGRIFVLDADRNSVMSFASDGAHLGSWGDYGPFSGLLNNPQDIDLVTDQVFVTDTNNHRVQVYASNCEALRQWGVHEFARHEGTGRIHYPHDLAIGGGDESGNGRFAVVCEPLEHRCQVFGALAPGQLEEPRQGIGAADAAHYGQRLDIDGRLCVIPDTDHHFVYVFDLKEEAPILISQVGQRGSKFSMFIRPTDAIANEADRSVTVADPSTGRLQQFALDFKPDGPLDFNPYLAKFVSAVDLTHARFARPVADLRWPLTPTMIRRDGDGNLHVLDSRNATVVVFDPEMNFVRCYGGFGTDDGALREPTDLAFSPDGATAYVVDAGNFRVQAFDRAGHPTVSFGSFGEGDGEFRQPFGIAVDDEGSVFVSDALADRVQKFDASGRFVAKWGARGINHGEFWRPAGMAIDSRQRLFVIDHGNHRAQMFSLDGEWLGTFGGGVPVTRSEME
jgi:DNA-binding beta-propeller fold protein YncE